MKVNQNSRVKLAYKVSLPDGRILEEVTDSEPEVLTLGEGAWPIKLELALFGEQTEAEVSVAVMAAEHAFGEVDPERIQQMPLTDFADEPEIGQLIEFNLPDGKILEGLVVEKDQTHADIDFNHPYAGRDILFDITILEVQS